MGVVVVCVCWGANKKRKTGEEGVLSKGEGKNGIAHRHKVSGHCLGGVVNSGPF